MLNNSYKKTLICLLLFALPFVSFGRNLVVTAGQISKNGLIEENETSLTINGSVNAADLHKIALTCKSIETLDLSNAKIHEYSGKPIVTNQSTYPADELPAYCLSDLKASNIKLPSSLKSIGDGALMNSEITEITIPASVTSIGVGAFANCTKLRTLHVPATVTAIGSHAFKSCTSLTDVSFDAVQVPDECFTDCTKLAKVTFGNGVKSIGEEAFNGCTALYSVTYNSPSSLASIGAGAYESTGVADVNLGNFTSLKSIGSHAYANCSQLETVQLPEGLESLGAGAFADCPKLTYISFPEGITEIPDLVLKGASSITDLKSVIHEDVSSIGRLAFAGDKSVATVSLPETLTFIGSGAFEAWDALGSIFAEKLGNVPALGSDVWLGVNCSSVELFVKENMFDAFKSADQWQDFNVKIYNSESSILDIPEEGDFELHIALKGNELELNSGKPMEIITIYDLNGRMIFNSKADGSISYSSTTPTAAGNVYIISVGFTDGATSVAKILSAY